MQELRTILVEFKYFPKYSLQETPGQAGIV